MTDIERYNNLLDKIDLLVNKKNNVVTLKLLKKSIKYNHLCQITNCCFNYLIIIILLVICFMFYFRRRHPNLKLKPYQNPYNIEYINRPSHNVEFLNANRLFNNRDTNNTMIELPRDSYYQKYRSIGL